jgi:inner membrane protein
MDTITQMLLGGAVAQAGSRRSLGRRAIVAGAAIALIPDLDVVAGWIGGPTATWLHHRGITHSLLFGPLVGPILGWAIWKAGRRQGAKGPDADSLSAWIWLSILALFTHPLIDLFTSYGTQLLAPLSNFRFAVNSMPIIEPVYSLALLLALLIGIFLPRRPRLARNVAAASLIFISIYTAFGWSINGRVEEEARAQLAVPTDRITAYPTMFQPYYRRVVARTADEVLVGYYSVLNHKQIEWRRYERHDDPRIAAVAATPEAEIFRWFSLNNLFWRVSEHDNGSTVVEALDTRYGAPNGNDLGFWGISAAVDESGRLLGPVTFLSLRPSVSRSVLGDLWRETFGG